MTISMASRGMACVVLIICIGIFVKAADIKPYCKPQSPDKKEPPLPDLDVDSFVVKYRATIVDKKYTLLATESYDSVNNKARMDILMLGIKSSLVLDYKDDSYVDFSYKDPEERSYLCQISALDKTSSDNFDVFGFKRVKKASGVSIPHVVSSQEVLQFARSNNPIHQGQTDLDGLVVDHWQSCITWADVDATFTLDYYFTPAGFAHADPLTPSQVPVRAEVRGTMKGANGPRSLHHVYEYLEFKAYKYTELPADTFSLPEFVVCERAPGAWERNFPVIPSSMSYTLETVSHASKEDGGDAVTVGVVTVYHDNTRRLVRVDERRTVTISDFSTGVEYVMEDDICTRRPIRPDNGQSAVSEGGVIKLGDRPEIKHLRGDFQLSGDKMFRGLPTVAFASVKNSDNDEQVAAFVDSDGKTPVGLKTVNMKKGTKTYYHIYNFVTGLESLRNKDPFDIRQCRNSDQMKDFEVTFAIKSTDAVTETDIMNHIDVILHAIRDTVAQIAGVSPLQVSYNDYSLDGTRYLRWLGSFLDGGQDGIAANVADKLATKSCEDVFRIVKESIVNEEFVQVFSKKKDAFSLELTAVGISSQSEELDLAVHSDIMYRFHTVKDMCVVSLKHPHVNIVSKTARECAQACIDSKSIDCNVFQYTKATKSCQFGWEISLPETKRAFGCDSYSLRYLDSFDVFKGVVLVKKNGVAYDSASSPEDCAKLCLKEKAFDCRSFDTCAEGRCQLHKGHYFDKDSSPSSGQEYVSCAHYSRKSLDDFHNTKDTTLTFPGQTSVVVRSNGECAYLCANDEAGCTEFSTCLKGAALSCLLVPQAHMDHVKFTADSKCEVYKSMNTAKSGRMAASSKGKNGDDGASGYSGGAMFGLGVAMILTGVGAGVLTIFLLNRFRGWMGFR